MRHTITRRQFLKVGGAAVVSTAAAGLLSSCGGSSASGSSTGGSGSSTYTLVYYIYKSAFTYYEMGYASAVAMVLFAILLCVTLYQWHHNKNND